MESLEESIKNLKEFEPSKRETIVKRKDYKNKTYTTRAMISNSFYQEQKKPMSEFIEKLVKIMINDIKDYPKYVKIKMILNQLLKIITENQIKTMYKNKMLCKIIAHHL